VEVVTLIKEDFEKFCKIVGGKFHKDRNICEIDRNSITEIGHGRNLDEFFKLLALREVGFMSREEFLRRTRRDPLIYVKDAFGRKYIFDTGGDVYIEMEITRFDGIKFVRTLREDASPCKGFTCVYSLVTYNVEKDVIIEKVDNTYYIREKV